MERNRSILPPEAGVCLQKPRGPSSDKFICVQQRAPPCRAVKQCQANQRAQKREVKYVGAAPAHPTVQETQRDFGQAMPEKDSSHKTGTAGADPPGKNKARGKPPKPRAAAATARFAAERAQIKREILSLLRRAEFRAVMTIRGVICARLA